MQRRVVGGTGLGLLSAASFATSGPFAASLLATGWTPGGAVTLRIAIAALVLTPLGVLHLRGRWCLLRRNLPAVLLYGTLAVAGAQLFFFIAVTHVSVGVALLVEYVGPFLVVAWMWLRHRQRPGRLTGFGAVLAVAGLVLVLDLTGAQRVDLVGVLWGLGAAAGLATYFVLSSGIQDPIPPLSMAWAGMVIASAVLGVAGAAGVLPFVARSADVRLAGAEVAWWVPVAGMALVAAVVSYTAGIGAARRLGARVASFLGLAEVLFAILFSWLLVDQQPTWLQLVGGIVVLAGIALVQADSDRPVAEPEPVTELAA